MNLYIYICINSCNSIICSKIKVYSARNLYRIAQKSIKTQIIIKLEDCYELILIVLVISYAVGTKSRLYWTTSKSTRRINKCITYSFFENIWMRGTNMLGKIRICPNPGILLILLPLRKYRHRNGIIHISESAKR